MVNRSLLPPEREALSIAASPSAWRALEHPRFTKRPPALDWGAARAIHDPAQAPWRLVRPLLLVLEAAAVKAQADRPSQEDEQ